MDTFSYACMGVYAHIITLVLQSVQFLQAWFPTQGKFPEKDKAEHWRFLGLFVIPSVFVMN